MRPLILFIHYYHKMQLTDKQLKIQECIMIASHPWLSLEEAKKKEFYSTPWCKVVRRKNWYTTVFATVVSTRYDMLYTYIQPYSWRSYSPVRIAEKDIEEIIWRPPTLPRVLNALWWSFWESKWYIFDQWREHCERKLLNEDWTDATLRDQSEETQDTISLLLWIKQDANL